MQQLPLFLVDDDAAVLDSLSFMLTQYGYQVQTFNSAINFCQQVDCQQAGCVILDSKMPEVSGQMLQQSLLEQLSPLAIIFMTGHGDLPMALDAFRKGASDFFQKPVVGKELVAAIEKAMLHSQQQLQQVNLQQKLALLSERETQVLSLVISGKTNKQMAEFLYVSLRTIEVHRAKIMKKLEVHNMAELVKFSSLIVPATTL